MYCAPRHPILERTRPHVTGAKERQEQTFLPANTHRASRSTALVSRKPRSTRRASSLNSSLGLPDSTLGDPMGLGWTSICNLPSFGLFVKRNQVSEQTVAMKVCAHWSHACGRARFMDVNRQLSRLVRCHAMCREVH